MAAVDRARRAQSLAGIHDFGAGNNCRCGNRSVHAADMREALQLLTQLADDVESLSAELLGQCGGGFRALESPAEAKAALEERGRVVEYLRGAKAAITAPHVGPALALLIAGIEDGEHDE